MGSKHYADVKIFKSTDPQGHLEIESNSVITTFYETGTLSANNNNGVMCWSSGDITHLNFDNKFSIMYDAENETLTFSDDTDKNLWYKLEDLIALVKETGHTIEEMKAVIEREKAKATVKEERKENLLETINNSEKETK